MNDSMPGEGRGKTAWILLTGTLCLLPLTSQAYLGPGAGVTMIGALLAVIAAVVLTLVGLLLWPLRMLLRKLKGGKPAEAEAEVAADNLADTRDQ